MAFGFPAYAEAERQYQHPQAELVLATGSALDALGWRFETPSPACFQIARVGLNFWSWGERVYIDVKPRRVVRIRSECVLPTQCFDWGKNQSNVKKFFTHLERVLREGTPDPA